MHSKTCQKRLFILFTVLLAMVLAVSFCAEQIAPHDPLRVNNAMTLCSPDAVYPFGTDDFGRCIFSRILYGLRSSVLMALIIVAVCAVVGTAAGLISGYCGGRIDDIIMRVIDMFLAFPGMVISIAVVGVLGVGWVNTAIALVIPGWLVFARLSRGLVLSVKEKDYIKSAKVAGLKPGQIIWRYVLPNIMQQVVIIAAIEIGATIIRFSALTFIGMGAQPPEPELGLMLNEAKSKMQIAPWMMIYPCVTIFIVVMLFNLMSDSLRDILDPSGE